MRLISLALLATVGLPALLSAQETRPPALLSAPVRYYPKALQDLSGRVVLQFVVQVSGRVDSSSIRVISATDPHFIDAARFTALAMTFDPARSKGAAVKMLVQQPISFTPRTQGCTAIITPVLTPLCVDSSVVLPGH
jgi:TonB family protein